MTNKNKVLVIGLDGATFDLMKPWMAQGHLPNLQALMQGGSSADLMSVIPPESPLAWPSFATGKNPGKHGIFGFYEPHSDDSYALSPINARTNRAKTMYRMLAEAGKDVITLAVPFTFPPEQIPNGIVIPGEFSLPGELAHTAVSHPPEMAAEIGQHVDDHRLGVDTSLVYTSPEDFITDLHTTTDNLMDVAGYLMAEKPWDFFMLVFSGVDQVEHYFFRDHLNQTEFQAAMLNYYKKVDESVGALLADLEDDTTVFVMSDHGMQPFDHYFCINLWLHQQGLLVFKKPAQRRLKQMLIRWLNQSGLKDKMLSIFDFRRFSRGAISNALSFDDIDFSKTKAYAYGFGSIRINLIGRDPQGMVDELDYETVRNQIMAGLATEVDEQNQPVLDGVFRREEIYRGSYVGNAPDVIVTSDRFWPNGLAGVGPFSNLYGSKVEKSPFINGMHAMNGIFMAQGPNIQPSAALPEANLIDLAPTILYTLGLPIPTDMDGQLLTDIFVPDYITDNQPQYIEVDPFESQADRYVWSDEEEEMLVARLQ
ncbi:MAG: alkaline phosphatase family protein, partial [Chloroflexota bacterium]